MSSPSTSSAAWSSPPSSFSCALFGTVPSPSSPSFLPSLSVLLQRRCGARVLRLLFLLIVIDHNPHATCIALPPSSPRALFRRGPPFLLLVHLCLTASTSPFLFWIFSDDVSRVAGWSAAGRMLECV